MGGPVDCNPGAQWPIFVLKMCMKELCHEYFQRIKNSWTWNLWNHALQLDLMALRALFPSLMVESRMSTAAWFGMSRYFGNILQFFLPCLIDFLCRTGVLRRMGGESVPTRTAGAECRAASRPMSGTLR